MRILFCSKTLIALVLLLICNSCQSTQSSTSPTAISRGEEISGIHWKQWSDETFRLAQAQDKLILLDLTAVWCHACHVMDETTYEDHDVISLLNDHFISIRVDTDQRPDIEARYRHGGWPTTSVLLPGGEIVFQANYLNPLDLREALLEAESLYRERKDELLSQAAEIWERVEEARKNRVSPRGAIEEGMITQTVSAIEQSFDGVNGGFRDAPKFFEPEAISFLLGLYHHTKNASLRDMALFSLKQQRKLIDSVWGGFYRYAVKADWTQPHFEKMLHLQAMNIPNYLEAYQLTHEEDYRNVVEKTMEYVRRFLVDQQGKGFFASQDADLRNVTGAQHYFMSGEEFFRLGETERQKLGMPSVDRTVYTGWNGLMIKSFLKVYQVFGGQDDLKMALGVLHHLYKERYKTGVGMAHREIDGRPSEFGLIGDQVAFADALLEASLTTGDVRYLEKAERLTKDFIVLLEDVQGGGFYDRPEEFSAEGLLKFPHKSLKENLQIALLLSDLYYVTEDRFYQDVAERTLQFVLAASEALPLGLSGLALDRFLRYPVHIVIVGSRDDEQTISLFREGLKLYASGKIVRLLDPQVNTLRIGEITFPLQDKATAYICTISMCSEPFHEATQFTARYSELVDRRM